MSRRLTIGVCLALLMALAGTVAARAQQPDVAMPGPEKVVLLVRNSLITLNNALKTGNYTVLRDIGAPGFREANSAARLAQIFADLGAKNIDLSAVAVITPQLTQQPSLDPEKGMLHLKGYFPGKPVQIDFELLYQAVNGQWRLFGISVQPGAPGSEQKNSEASGSTSTAKKKKK
jgi:hypothetical protein